MSIPKEISLGKAGTSEDVVLFGFLGKRILNPGYLNNSFIPRIENKVEIHVLKVIAIVDRIGILAGGRASMPLITSGEIAVSTEDSSLEGSLVYIRGNNKFLHLVQSPIGDYYAVSWRKVGDTFIVIPDKVIALTPDKFRSQQIRDVFVHILNDFDERIVDKGYSCNNNGKAMLAMDSANSKKNYQSSYDTWTSDTTLSISHSKFNGVDSSHLQDILDGVVELNQSYYGYTRDESDKKLLSTIDRQWSKELEGTGVFARKALADSSIESYRAYILSNRLSRYLVHDERFPERVLWCLQYLPDYGPRRIHRWVDMICRQLVPTDEDLDNFTDLVLQYGHEALAVLGKQEYDSTKKCRPGYCLSIIPGNKLMSDTVTPFFAIFPSSNVVFYPETTSTSYWLEQCESYGSVVSLPTSSLVYYVPLEKFVQLCNLIIILEDHKNLLSLTDVMDYHKKYKAKTYESELEAWSRLLRVNRPTDIEDYPDDGVSAFIKDYLRDDGKYVNPAPTGIERLLRIVSTL